MLCRCYSIDDDRYQIHRQSYTIQVSSAVATSPVYHFWCRYSWTESSSHHADIWQSYRSCYVYLYSNRWWYCSTILHLRLIRHLPRWVLAMSLEVKHLPLCPPCRIRWCLLSARRMSYRFHFLAQSPPNLLRFLLAFSPELLQVAVAVSLPPLQVGN